MKRGTRFPRAMGVMTRLAFARAHAASIPTGPLLERAGLTQRQIDDSRARVRVRDQIEFMNQVATATNDDLLGFHLAEKCEMRAVGLYYYVLASSETVWDVCQRAARYTSLVNEGAIQECVDGRDISIRTGFSGVSRYNDRHQVEFWSATLVRLLRELTGLQLNPNRVRLAHPRKEGAREMAAYFGCEVEFGASFDEVVFPKKAGGLPIVHADPFLNRLLLEICEETVSRKSKNPGSVRTRVENEIATSLPHGKARIPLIASRLGLSQRTLARHLADEGTSFSELLGKIRRELASRYIKDETLSMSQIAWLLGFQDLGAFSHAFKRWHGTAPRNAAARVR